MTRSLYFYKGDQVVVGEKLIDRNCAIEVSPDVALSLKNPKETGEPAEILMLQGRPINEPIAQHGPFVVRPIYIIFISCNMHFPFPFPFPDACTSYPRLQMNTREEIMEAFQEYRMGLFGKWPWPEDDPVAPRGEGRYAKYSDGRVERPRSAVGNFTDKSEL